MCYEKIRGRMFFAIGAVVARDSSMREKAKDRIRRQKGQQRQKKKKRR